MYVPSAFRLDEAAARAFIAAHDFGLLLSACDGSVEGSHLPFALRERDGRCELLAHLARANPQSRSIDGAAATVVFQGAHGYVSPTWYETPHGVPTWNYSAVHAVGTARLGDRDDLFEHFERTAATHEPAGPGRPPWSVARLPAELREQLLAAIVPVVVSVERFEGKAKLSQNRSAADVAGVLAALDAQGDAASIALAAAMREIRRDAAHGSGG